MDSQPCLLTLGLIVLVPSSPMTLFLPCIIDMMDISEGKEIVEEHHP